MLRGRLLPLVGMLLLLLGLACSGIDPATLGPTELPSPEWVGQWDGPGIHLEILPDGMVEVRRTGSVDSTMTLPGRQFGPDALIVGVGPFNTSWPISAPPHQTPDGAWAMTFDGVELLRSAAPRSDGTIPLPPGGTIQVEPSQKL